MLGDKMNCFLVVLTLLIMTAIIVPQYADYSHRVETREWLRYIKPTQTEIEKNILLNKTVNDSGVGFKIPPQIKDMEYTNITRDGVIFLKGGHKGQFITLIPSIIKGKVTWKCVGGSTNDMVQKCKGT